MARRRRKVIAKDYDVLIKASEEKITKLTQDLKEERSNLKRLKKDKTYYDEQKAEEEKREKLKEVINMIEVSGKSLEEIEAFLSST